MKVVRVQGHGASAKVIGRGTVWGNPFIIGADGDRDTVIAKFYHYAKWRLEREPDWLEPLRGWDLACYCAPQACHGDAIIRLLEESKPQNCQCCDSNPCLELAEANAEFFLTSDEDPEFDVADSDELDSQMHRATTAQVECQSCSGKIHEVKVIDNCLTCPTTKGAHVPHFPSNPNHATHCTCDGCY